MYGGSRSSGRRGADRPYSSEQRPKPTDDSQTDRIDWSLTTWEGARREQMRRWGSMPLADMILALEEMQALADKLAHSSGPHRERP